MPEPPSSSDWRIRNQRRYLMGASFALRPFEPTERDDHDHCEFCTAKFSRAPGDLREGYVSYANEYVYWVCPECYRDFEEEFKWRPVPS